MVFLLTQFDHGVFSRHFLRLARFFIIAYCSVLPEALSKVAFPECTSFCTLNPESVIFHYTRLNITKLKKNCP